MLSREKGKCMDLIRLASDVLVLDQRVDATLCVLSRQEGVSFPCLGRVPLSNPIYKRMEAIYGLEREIGDLYATLEEQENVMSLEDAERTRSLIKIYRQKIGTMEQRLGFNISRNSRTAHLIAETGNYMVLSPTICVGVCEP